jgi:hypothetical protein
MTLTVQHVPQQYTAQTWPLVEKFIAATEKFGGDDYSLEQIKMYVTLGHWTLLVATDEDNQLHGAMTIAFQNYPNDRVAFVTSAGGAGIVNEPVLDQLKAVLRGMGATKIQAGGRPAMVRLLENQGFTRRYTVVETKI